MSEGTSVSVSRMPYGIYYGIFKRAACRVPIRISFRSATADSCSFVPAVVAATLTAIYFITFVLPLQVVRVNLDRANGASTQGPSV